MVQLTKVEAQLKKKKLVWLKGAKTQQPEKGSRNLRRTIKPLYEVWMDIGVKKLENYKRVSINALLDSSAARILANK